MCVFLLLATCVAVACAGVFLVQSTHEAPVRAQGEQPAPNQPEEAKDDDAFAELPAEGLFEGTVPQATTKVVVLHAANVDSLNDHPKDDLKSADRYIAQGLTLMLDQQVQYMPELITENAASRVERFGARLRHPDVPHAGDAEIAGTKHARLDEGLKTFNADVLFIVSFVPGDEGAKGLVYRYAAGKGVHAERSWDFGKLGKPEPDSVTLQLEGIVAGLCDGYAASEHAPIPRLVHSDKALRAFARMTLALADGDATEGWIEYETLMSADERAGRSAHYAMEMFLALADQQSNARENRKYLIKAMEAGRNALKHVPNDTHIRGRLGWIASTHFGRYDFGRMAIEQALKVQPANTNEIERYLSVYMIDSADAQLAWLKEYALPKVKTGRMELTIATLLFNTGDYPGGVEWYKKALTIAPGDFETQLSAGLCGFYKGRALAKARKKKEAAEAYNDAVDALRAALRIDPQEVAYLYDYYVRASTHEFTRLPPDADDRDELFLVQAVLTALQSNSRSFKWDRLVKEVLPVQKRLLRATIEEAEPTDDLYVLKLLAGLRIAIVDKDNDGVVHTLWLMKEAGFRPELYVAYMNSFGPVVNEYQPETPDDEPEAPEENPEEG